MAGQPASSAMLVPNPGRAGWRARLPGSAPVLTETDGAQREVALTFDDGPDPKGTGAVLDALDSVGAVATFFVLADGVAKDPDVAREVLSRGHAIGLHGDRHERLDRSGLRELRRRLSGARAQVEDIVGVPLTLHRPPFGRLSWRTIQVCGDLGLRVAMWSHDPGDWRGIDEPTLTSLLRRCLVPGAIVLLHDGNAETATTTARAIVRCGEHFDGRLRTVRLTDVA